MLGEPGRKYEGTRCGVSRMGLLANRCVSSRRNLRHLSRSPGRLGDNISHHLRWENGPDNMDAGAPLTDHLSLTLSARGHSVN